MRLLTYVDALAWTLILETPVALAAGKFWDRGLGRSLIAALVASGVTHPVAWRLALAMPAPDYQAWGWHAIEGGVCCVEAVILGRIMRLPAKRAWPLSIVANSVSALAGRFVL
jgi:hypothetical protein